MWSAIPARATLVAGVGFSDVRCDERGTVTASTDTKQTFLAELTDQGADDNPVEVGGKRTTLPALITQKGDAVSLTAAIPDPVFVED